MGWLLLKKKFLGLPSGGEIFIELCLKFMQIFGNKLGNINTLNAELNPICHLLALLGAHHILHIGRIRVNSKHFVYIYNIGTSMGHTKDSPTTQFVCAAVSVARWKLEPLGPASMQ